MEGRGSNLETESTPQQTVKSVEEIDGADLVVGILADLGQDAVAALCDDLRALPGNPRVVVLQNAVQNSLQNHAASGSTRGSDSFAQNSSLFLLPWTLQGQTLPTAPFESVTAAFNSIFALSERLGARGCCVVASHLEYAPSKWICRLTEPLLDKSFDFVAPRYGLRKFEGLLNHSIISPLTRSLYGKRIQNPMGPDFGISQQLFQTLWGAQGRNGERTAGGMNLLASLLPRAVCSDLRVCQVYLGARTYPPPDWTAVSSLLTQVLGPVFLAMERSAACWQKTRASTPVRTLNQPLPVPQPAGSVEVARLVNSFQLGVRDLQEIWGLVLPPAILLELRKLSRSPAEQHRFPDELWVRIVYDFALAHRLRTINRDHLLASLTPLYLGWVASYAREIENSEVTAAEQRLERLALAYEAEKPYLVSRWRWPDRFNP